MSSKDGKLKVKSRKYVYGASLIKFEKKCFDWIFAGKVINDVDDGYEGRVNSSGGVTVTHKHHIVKTAWFRRPYDYAKNALFSFTEMLSNIVSHIREWALNFVIPVVIIAVILMVLEAAPVGTVIGIVAGIYGGLIAASLLLAGLGLLWRKVFKLTEKTDAIQEQKGYAKWSEYEDDNSVDYVNS